DSAAHFYWQLIHVSEKNRYKKGESVGYSNLASVLEKQNRYNEALELKQKGLEIDRQIGDVYGAMNSHRGLAETYMLMGETKSAIQALDEAFLLCDTSWIVDLSGIHLTYYQLLKKDGKPEDALSHYEKYIELSNRINESKSRETVIDLLAQYETEKKEQQILLLEQANLLKENRLRLQWLVIGVLVLLGVLIAVTAWSVIRHKNQKLKQMKTELQHFLLHEKEAEKLVKTSNQSPQKIYTEKWGLTSRESEILHHLGQGCPNAQIAEKLFISENTVKFHIKNIYIKLNVKNRMEAVLRCSEKLNCRLS
ncbi:MAG: LuxR C-terminal-related transcriptional regulator, partial [Mariniphaga sp.]